MNDLSTGVPLLQGQTTEELYEWPVTPSTIHSIFDSPSPKKTCSRWHARLEHPSASILNSVISHFKLLLLFSTKKKCLAPIVLLIRAINSFFSKSSITSNRLLQIIFSDLWSSPITSIENHKYYIVLVDHYTRYTWLYPLARKSQVRKVFIAYKALVEKQFQAHITTLYSDNGGKYIALRSFLTENGIAHLTTPPHTPEHNGLSERKHIHVFETGMTLLSQTGVPKHYWPYAFATSVFLINQMPTSTLAMETPFQKLFAKPPNYSNLKVFGCLCFPWLPPTIPTSFKTSQNLAFFSGIYLHKVLTFVSIHQLAY